MFFIDKIARDMISSRCGGGYDQRSINPIPDILSHPTSKYAKIGIYATLVVFPLTSILLGGYIIKRAISSEKGSMPRRITCIILGCIATLGLGIIIFIIQILFSAFKFIYKHTFKHCFDK